MEQLRYGGENVNALQEGHRTEDGVTTRKRRRADLCGLADQNKKGEARDSVELPGGDPPAARHEGDGGAPGQEQLGEQERRIWREWNR